MYVCIYIYRERDTYMYTHIGAHQQQHREDRHGPRRQGGQLGHGPLHDGHGLRLRLLLLVEAGIDDPGHRPLHVPRRGRDGAGDERPPAGEAEVVA